MDFAGTHSTINDSELLYAELVRLLQAECGWMAPSDPALHAAQAAIAKFKNQGRSVSSKSLHHAIANVTLAIECHRRVSGGRYIRWNAQRGQYVPLSDIHSAASVISSAWRRRCRTHIEEAAGTEAEAPALPLSASPEADLIPVEQQSPVAAPPEQQSPSRTASPLQMLPLQPSALPSASHHQVHTAQEEEEEEEEEGARRRSRAGISPGEPAGSRRAEHSPACNAGLQEGAEGPPHRQESGQGRKAEGGVQECLWARRACLCCQGAPHSQGLSHCFTAGESSVSLCALPSRRAILARHAGIADRRGLMMCC